MRAVEVLGLGGYSVIIIKGLWFISIIDYWSHIVKYEPEANVRERFVNRDKLFEMTGTTTSVGHDNLITNWGTRGFRNGY